MAGLTNRVNIRHSDAGAPLSPSLVDNDYADCLFVVVLLSWQAYSGA
jgi:hypothetical protein